jgi:hypothetical protein
MAPIQEGSGNTPQQAFVSWKDPQGNPLVSINRDGTIFCQGVGFAQGGALLVGPIPIIQVSDDQVNSILPTMITETLALQTLYQVTFYYGPSGTTGSGTWTPVLTWTDPPGNSLNLNGYLGAATAGSVDNFQSYSLPCFCKAGTPISIVGNYSGTPFPMNISLRIVAMP